MEEFITKIVDSLLGGLDFPLMLSINVCTYLVIKLIDYLNKEKNVPTWLKRTIAVLCGLIFSYVFYILGLEARTCVNTMILSLVSWDCLFKPIIKKIGIIDYNK